MKRRILSALLALVMILSLVPAQVFAVATDDAVEAPAQEIVSLEETEPVQEEPVQEEPVQEEPVQEEPVQEEPVQKEPVQEEPVQEEPVQEEPVQEEPVQEESVQEVQSAEVPAPVMKNVAAIADPTYTVTFDANDANGNALRYVEIQIVNSNGETVDHVETGYRGTATYSLPSGTYTAIVSYTSGNYAYYAEEDFTVADAAKTVVLTVRSDYSTSAAESTYNRTTYFNHVDIRVKGTYTTGTTVDLTTYNIRLANVKIVVTNPSSYSRYNFSQTFTNNSETYEWRKTGVRVYKGASVALTCDIYDSVTGEILKSGFTHTFYDGTHNGTNYGNTEFVKAIKQCDMHQGLDFIIDPQEIIEAVFHSVSHEWHVVDAEGNVIGDLPEGLANLPATREDAYENGDDHTIDTHHVEGHYVIDEENGKLYTFQGWNWWSHEDDNNLKENTIGSDQTTVTVTDDTVIYGVWTVTDLELADSHITITKKFTDSQGNEVTAPADFHMLLTGPQGGSMEIALSQFTYANGVYSFELPVYTEGEYTIAEHEYGIEGYTTAASVTVKESATAVSSGHDHITAGEGTANADSATFTLNIDYATRSACAHVGEVDFVNTYAKSVGSDVHNYPNLAVNKLDADDRTILEGATFVLYKNYANGQFSDEVASGTSDESGYVYFRNLEPGTYYLTETEAPAGYLAGSVLYRVSVTLKDGFPKEVLMNGAWCQYYEYDMSVDYSLDDGATWSASQHFSLGTTGNRFRLAAFNEKVTGALTITKTFSGLDAEHIPASVTVTVAYPDGSTTDHVLNAANNWTVTLTGLELGKYTLSEHGTQINGYKFAGVTFNGSASATVEIGVEDIPADYDKGEPVAEVSVAVRNTYDKKEADYYVWPDLTVRKVRDANGQRLSGATFALAIIRNSAAAPYQSGTTDAAGKLVFTDIGKEYAPATAPQVGDVLASFNFYEYEAPAGYVGMEGVYVVDLVVKSITEMEDPHTDGVFYTVYETELKITDPYTRETVDLTDGELVVENTKNVGDLTVQKTFGVHNAYIPASITAQVTGPNGYSNTVTLNAANNWTVTLKNVPLGTYTVTEPETVTNIDGHPLYSADSTTSTTVTLSSGVDSGVDLSKGTAVLKNTYTREVINPAAFQVKKVDSVTGAIITTGAEFTLYSDSACTQAVQVENTGADGIATFYGFTDAATYYLKETAAPVNYELSESVWEITVSLKDGDPVIKVNEKTNIWETIFNYITGSSHSDWANGVLTVENVKKTAYIAIHKNVIDTEKYYEGAEYSFTFDASDDAFDTQFTLKAGEHKNIENVPYGITYTITEDTTNAAYTAQVVDTGNGKVETDFITVTFINTYEYQVLKPVLNLLKVDADTNAPIQNAIFYLYGDPECTEYISGAVSDDEGKVEIPLPNALYYSTYYLKEMTPAEGYYPNETVYVVNAEMVYTVQNAGTDEAYTEKAQILTISALNKTGDAYVVENTAIKPVKITVTKEWNDGGYHARPQEVIVTLYKDGGAYETKILDEDNGWTHTWEGPEFTDQYTWTVDEADVHVPEGYTKSVSADSNTDPLVYDYTVTNTRAPKPVEITVTKAWEHNNGKVLPEFINVTLYENGEIYETVTLNEANGWTYTWSDLTDVSLWSVDEAEVPVGYEKDISVDGYSFTITNTRIIQPITVNVEKVWKDGSSKDRPKSVDVVLYRDGEVYETVTLNADNDWSYSWDLTDEYDWTVDEDSVPSGYKKKVTHSGNDWTITNTLKKIPKTGDDTRLLSLQIMCVVGLAGVAMCAYLLITPRKKEELQ